MGFVPLISFRTCLSAAYTSIPSSLLQWNMAKTFTKLYWSCWWWSVFPWRIRFWPQIHKPALTYTHFYYVYTYT